MRKARRKGLSLRGDISLATVPLRGLLGAFTMRPPRRSSIWLVLTLRPRNVCNKRTRGQARPNGHQRKRKSACGVYSYGVPRHSWMNKRALQRRLYEENCPSLRTRVGWRAGSIWVDFARLDQQAWQLSNGIVWPGRGSKRRITVRGQVGLLQFFGDRQD